MAVEADWSPREVAQMLGQAAGIMCLQSDVVYRDPEVRLMATVLQAVLDSRLGETQRT